MSTTGTRPVIAAPIAEPTMAASEIGALSTRSAPNSSISPFVTPKGTPSTMSSPMQYTRGSRRISSRRARLRASPKSITGTSISPRVVSKEIVQRLRGLGQRAGLGVSDRVVDLGDDAGADALAVRVVEQPARLQPPAQPRDGVARAAVGDLVLGAVGLRVALEVTDPAHRVRLDQRRAVAATPALGGAAHGLVHGQDVVAVHRLPRDPVAGGARGDGAARGR